MVLNVPKTRIVLRGSSLYVENAASKITTMNNKDISLNSSASRKLAEKYLNNNAEFKIPAYLTKLDEGKINDKEFEQLLSDIEKINIPSSVHNPIVTILSNTVYPSEVIVVSYIKTVVSGKTKNMCCELIELLREFGNDTIFSPFRSLQIIKEYYSEKQIIGYMRESILKRIKILRSYNGRHDLRRIYRMVRNFERVYRQSRRRNAELKKLSKTKLVIDI